MKRCTLLWAGLFAALASLTGCISGPDLTGQPFFTSPAQPRADEATVYFYRTSASIGNGVAPTIQVDGRAIGSLPSGSFFKAGIPAGKHSVASTSPPIISGMVNQRFDITVENGKVYYIADQLSTSAYTDGQTLVKSTAVVSVEQCFTRATRWCLPRKRCVLSSGARSCRQPHGSHASRFINSQLAESSYVA